MIPNLISRQYLAQALALQGTQRYVPVIAGRDRRRDARMV
jgi:hypothetical protein